MRGERVAWAGEAVHEEASHLVEVDVQGNLFSDWAEVGKLALQMPRLEVLHLNGNIMKPLSMAPVTSLLSAFSRLRVLVLNSCGLTSWVTIASLQQNLPSLQELSAANNRLSDVLDVCGALSSSREPVRVQGFGHLERLDLSATGLSSWSQVAVFAEIPNLRSLHLNENQLSSLSCGSGGPQGFSQLDSLHLSSNMVVEWSAIDELDAYPRLVALRFTNNPLTKTMGQSEVRQILIGRLRRLTRLNGAEISKKERVDAEKSYLRRVAREVGQSNGDKEAAVSIWARHPRYKELLEMYGEGQGGQGPSEGTGTLASELLAVRLVSMAASSMTTAPVDKRLPGSLTVGRLKQLLHRQFKLEPDLQILYYKSDKMAPPTMLEEDTETLAYYGVPSGCDIFMNEIDVKAKAREEEERRQEEEARLAQQMHQVNMLDQYRKAQVHLETASVQRVVAGEKRIGGI